MGQESSTNLSEFKAIAETVAPELKGRLTLCVRNPDWPMPPHMVAGATWNPPPWIEAADGLVLFEAVAMTLDTLLHELAHLVPAPIAPPVRSSLEAYQRGWTAPLYTKAMPRYFDHEDRFIRRLIHLAYRAEQQGHPVDLEAAFHGPHYGLRSVLEYQSALGDEPARCLEMAFSQIEETAPPEQFTRVFAEDKHLEALSVMRGQLEQEVHALRVKMLKLEFHIEDLFAENYSQTQPLRAEILHGGWTPERFQDIARQKTEINANFDAEIQTAENEYRRLKTELKETEAKILIFAPPCPAPPVRADV